MAQDETLNKLLRCWDEFKNDPNATDRQIEEAKRQVDERIEIVRRWERKIDDLSEDLTGQDLDAFLGIEP